MLKYHDGVLHLSGNGVYIAHDANELSGADTDGNVSRNIDLNQVKAIVIGAHANIVLVNVEVDRLSVTSHATASLVNCVAASGNWSDTSDISVTDSAFANCTIQGSTTASRSTFTNCKILGTSYNNCCFGSCKFYGWYQCFGCVFDECTFEPDDPGDDEVYGAYSCCTFVDCDSEKLHGSLFQSTRRMNASDRAFCYLAKMLCAGLDDSEFVRHPYYEKLIKFADKASDAINDSKFINAKDALKFALIGYKDVLSREDKRTICWIADIDDDQW